MKIYFPNDHRMLLRADGNGDEIDHLFVRDIEGNITDITPEKGAKSNFMAGQKTTNIYILALTKEIRDILMYIKCQLMTSLLK